MDTDDYSKTGSVNSVNNGKTDAAPANNVEIDDFSAKESIEDVKADRELRPILEPIARPNGTQKNATSSHAIENLHKEWKHHF